MPSNCSKWIFKEEQRNDVCNGKLCPKCLGIDIKCTGFVPDGINMNYGYHCDTCNEDWEGY